MEEINEDYRNVGQDEVRVIRRVLEVLRHRELGREQARAIALATVFINFHPMPPVICIYIHASEERGYSYELDYTPDRLSFSMYHIDEVVYEDYLYECLAGGIPNYEHNGYFLEDFEDRFLHLLKESPTDRLNIYLEL